jgi:hypothetical protein
MPAATYKWLIMAHNGAVIFSEDGDNIGCEVGHKKLRVRSETTRLIPRRE